MQTCAARLERRRGLLEKRDPVLSVVDHNAIELAPRISEAEVGDYVALLKPRVMSLVIFTALVGLVIAPGHVHPGAGLHLASSASRSAPAPPAR